MDPAGLRPLGIGEIIDVAIKVYRARFGVLVKSVAVVLGPVFALIGIVLATIFGAELTVRKLGGRVTTAASYSYGESEIRGGPVEYTSPWSRRHSFDATATVSASARYASTASVT